jgi:Uma2 family endonuclease
MSELVIDLAPDREQTEFNFERWAEIQDDPQLDDWIGRIETDRHGHVIMSPHAGYNHMCYSRTIFLLLEALLEDGIALQECPVSTADGMRIPDVIWISNERRQRSGRPLGLDEAPEICVEILSPRNRKRERDEKRKVLFAAGATEVWHCDGNGQMTFFTGPRDSGSKHSKFCAEFPPQVEKS